jgi:hypothetical protein
MYTTGATRRRPMRIQRDDPGASISAGKAIFSMWDSSEGMGDHGDPGGVMPAALVDKI